MVAGVQRIGPLVGCDLCNMWQIRKKLAGLVFQVQECYQDVFRIMSLGHGIQKRSCHSGLSSLASSDELEVLLIETDLDRRIALLCERSSDINLETVGLNMRYDLLNSESGNSN